MHEIGGWIMKQLLLACAFVLTFASYSSPPAWASADADPCAASAKALVLCLEKGSQISQAETDRPVAAMGKPLAIHLPESAGLNAGKASISVFYAEGHGESFTAGQLRTLDILSWTTSETGTASTVKLIVPDVGVEFFEERELTESLSFIILYRPDGADNTLTDDKHLFLTQIEAASPFQGRVFAGLFVLVFYTLIVTTFYYRRAKGGKDDIGDTNTVLEPVGWLECFSPLELIRGKRGQASLSNFQTLFFTLIIASLLAYALWITHSLGDLSDDVMILLGIAGGGSIAAKSVSGRVSRLDPGTWAWLVSIGWVKDRTDKIKAATIGDLVMRDGRVDVFRFQNLLFTFLVGASLFLQDVGGLQDYTIPTAIFGLLGFSQIAYVGGKVADTNPFAELSEAVAKLRAAIKAMLLATTPDQMTGTAQAKMAMLPDKLPAQWMDFKSAESEAMEQVKVVFPGDRSDTKPLTPKQIGLDDSPALVTTPPPPVAPPAEPSPDTPTGGADTVT